MFIEEGYAKVSIRKIAERVEYSPATIYLYFQNKDELMFFVQQEAFDQFFEILAPVLSLQDPIEQLRHNQKDIHIPVRSRTRTAIS